MEPVEVGGQVLVVDADGVVVEEGEDDEEDEEHHEEDHDSSRDPLSCQRGLLSVLALFVSKSSRRGDSRSR